MIEKYVTGTGTNEGFEENDNSIFAKYLTEFNQLNQFPNVNSLITTTYQGKNSKYAIFSTPYKTDILVLLNNNENVLINSLLKNQTIDVLVTEIIDNKKETIMYGSVSDVDNFIRTNKINAILETYLQKNEVLTGIPIGYTIYGYDVAINIDFEEVIIHLPHLLTDVNKLPNPESIIGQEIQFKILKDENNNFIASRKAYLLSLAKKELKNLKIGEVYTGFVTGTRSFAVFVQIGNLTGMVHESNLGDVAKEMLKNGEILPGMEIDVYLKDIINGKLTLTQIMRKSLWDTIKNGEKLNGEVSAIKEFESGDFGILVSLDYETRGMIHSSNITKSKEDFKIGEKLNVTVLNVFKNKRQITLTL